MQIKADCWLCGRRIDATLTQVVLDRPVYCPEADLSACLVTVKAQMSPPVVDDAPDPAPSDLETCGLCRGVGEVHSLDPTGEPRREWGTGAPILQPCPWCVGEGRAMHPITGLYYPEVPAS